MGIGDAGYEICVTDSEKKGTFSLKQSYHIPCLMSAVDSISMKFSDIFFYQNEVRSLSTLATYSPTKLILSRLDLFDSG